MRVIALLLLASGAAPAAGPVLEAQSGLEYKVLATNKTSTMQKELSEAGRMGYRFVDVMGGETLGGSEVVTVVARPPAHTNPPRYEYLVLATSKTSTMQEELSRAGEQGFAYLGQSVAQTSFGGQEVIVILGRTEEGPHKRYGYRLQATKRTKTMGRELNEVVAEGFELVGLTVSKTAFAGSELVSILMREE